MLEQYRIIDFHTHAFPERIAGRTIDVLREGMRRESGTDRVPAFDGTVDGLRTVMKKSGVDISVILPIVTKPKQTEHINDYAAEVNTAYGDLVSFGSVHPADPTAPETVKRLAEAGFRGIKLHPEFQGTYIDGEETLRVLRSASECGLAVTVHAGADIGLPPPVHCTPEMLLRVIDRVPDLTLIVAHLGGWMMWDKVAELLCDSPILFDTAFIMDFIEPSRAVDIITSHGNEKILFGSDCPWENPADTLDFILSLGLTDEDNRRILGENAEKILGI